MGPNLTPTLVIFLFENLVSNCQFKVSSVLEFGTTGSVLCVPAPSTRPPASSASCAGASKASIPRRPQDTGTTQAGRQARCHDASHDREQDVIMPRCHEAGHPKHGIQSMEQEHQHPMIHYQASSFLCVTLAAMNATEEGPTAKEGLAAIRPPSGCQEVPRAKEGLRIRRSQCTSIPSTSISGWMWQW